MDAKELRELIDIISRSAFTNFELEKDGFKLKLVKGGGGAAVPESAPLAPPPIADMGSSATPPVIAASPSVSEGLTELTSPIVGTFYRAPGPGLDAFVEIGSRVRKGQILCIIEAMKLMNEIEAETDAEVVEICVQNAQPVEFGEVLFRLRPLS